MNFNVFSAAAALKLMISLMVLVIVFHLMVLLEFIPYSIVWAGKLSDADEMRVFEIVSIGINVVILIALLFKGNYLRNPFSPVVIDIALWLFAAVFFLNTIGNLFSKTKFELYVFTPLTLLSGLLCLRIVLSRSRAV